MEPIDKLRLLMSQIELEPAADPLCDHLPASRIKSLFISPAVRPDGSKIQLLKTLLTSVCERNCYYCPFRQARDTRRATFTPDEFARLFMSLYRARVVDGIFLSSGVINGGIVTQDKLIATAEILRLKHEFNGYIHLKIMPGAEKEQVMQAMRLSDRISINLEAPNSEKLLRLAPEKQFFNELYQPLKWSSDIRKHECEKQSWNGNWPSAVTQFVVGAAEETDVELLTTTQHLYKNLNIKRAYYSAFTPITDTPLENQPPASRDRERRLYEASFLLRDYGYDMEELVFDTTGNLPLQADPKSLWADQHITCPIELNRADRHELLRIPGIGIKGSNAIIIARRTKILRSLEELGSLGINTSKAAPYILLNGAQPPQQLSFQW